nr:MAG: hypothetical protein DIU78_19310 [Pseudomonadota bacterium]
MVTPDEATSIPELYERALQIAHEGRYEEAASAFERIVALDPHGELADDALFQAAHERDRSGALDLAARRYQDLARTYPHSPLALPALVRAVRILCHLERWQEAGELASTVLAREGELGPFDRVLLHAARALERLAANDEPAASSYVERGRSLIDEHALDAAGRISRDLAALYFALGELRRRRAERIGFVPLPADFATVLERRCELLLAAQSAYSDAMRAYDAHWSTMAGVRVGELYAALHRDLMRITPLSGDTPEKRRLFEGALRLRYSVLLEKALGMVEHTLGMAERTGERSAWVDQARRLRADLQAEVRAEQAALDRLPYSRATLEAALEELGNRHAGAGKAAGAGRATTPPSGTR